MFKKSLFINILYLSSPFQWIWPNRLYHLKNTVRATLYILVETIYILVEIPLCCDLFITVVGIANDTIGGLVAMGCACEISGGEMLSWVKLNGTLRSDVSNTLESNIILPLFMWNDLGAYVCLSVTSIGIYFSVNRLVDIDEGELLSLHSYSYMYIDQCLFDTILSQQCLWCQQLRCIQQLQCILQLQYTQ